jgi:hypothetical protein
MKKGNNSKMGNQIYFKIAGYVDLDMLKMPITKFQLRAFVYIKQTTVNFEVNRICYVMLLCHTKKAVLYFPNGNNS